MRKHLLSVSFVVASALLFASLKTAFICGPVPAKMAAESDIEQLGKAIALYGTLLDKPISQLQDLSSLISTEPRIIQNLPKDPWGGRYQYKYLGGKTATFIVWSEGSLNSQEGLILYSFSKQSDKYISTRLNSKLD
ncbi:hypothetical protein N474_23395 [Pseudoalteromonas luteoviolacea CPMOR-2]|uniref:Type II secretion system protein GspG C-terminal domain-containing protein n=1 Tax=Pseudoalteromonas luteoviolacea DSM 6061 TaxID=1365250 RepID=A0A162A4J5_9GAMM|nr:type II secretion system protein GspG [Pseudoalteromonas luteoviolacea]KZN44073.1 hypothetical protein N475_08165 [Pseudoalteromonas luteoviolacea DSM 6061]KZN52163.1 hypothetical protein N474_23395 [Pseudoalteromonas luteoviolacea CPMOR-2]MBE0386186.1 hypothetical protein [Pseudoalteromonas luteoviolacea DSM 6061]